MRPTILLLAVAALAGLSLGFVSVAWGTPAGNTALIAPLLGGPVGVALAAILPVALYGSSWIGTRLVVSS